MKKIFSLLIIIFSIFSFGQKKFSTNEIMNSYPFNNATKVKIVSYNAYFISEIPTPLPPMKGLDSVEIKRFIANQKFPIKLENVIGKESLDGINKSKTLNYTEVFELSKLLYNTCGKFSSNIREVTKCFFPRNAVLFYDENDKVFEILEICFECFGIRFSSDNSMEINYMCDGFYPKIEEYFNKKGFSTQYLEEE